MSIIERIGISFRIYWKELSDIPEFERLEAIISAISTHDYIFRDALEAYFAEEGSELAGMGRIIFIELHRLFNLYLTNEFTENLQGGQEKDINGGQTGENEISEVDVDRTEDCRLSVASVDCTGEDGEFGCATISLAYAGGGFVIDSALDDDCQGAGQPGGDHGSAERAGADC